MAEIKHIRDLTFDPRNARRRTERSYRMIQESIQEVGLARSIVIDEDGVILAGNGTVECAGQIGIDRVRIIDADGDEIIAVRRKGLTPEQKQRLSLYDNRTADLAEWDPEMLARLQIEGAELDAFWSDAELQEHFNRASGLFEDEKAVDPYSEWEDMPEYEHENKKPYRSIVVHFASEDDLADFSKRLEQPISDKARYIWHPQLIKETFADKKYVSET